MEDRLSTLPDSVLGLILSKIPIIQAINCSILSKRWRYIYTHICELNLSPSLLFGLACLRAVSMERAEDMIFNFLQLHHQYDLEAFHLNNHVRSLDLPKWRFIPDSVSKWIQYAGSKNVQRVILCGNLSKREIIPYTLFSCARLTTLHISNYTLSNIPTDLPCRFNHLITCSFSDIKSTDESLALFIAHCPLLESLAINSFIGLLNPVISAPNLTHLDVTDLDVDWDRKDLEGLTINCPKFISLKTAMIGNLSVNGVCFHDLSYAVRELKMQCGSLIELYMEPLEGWKPGPYKSTTDTILDIVGTFKSLKKLSIATVQRLRRENEEMAVPLFALLERLPNLEHLDMRGMFALELARDRIPPCLSSPLGNLRIVRVDINNFDEKEIAVLGCLLQSTPALEIMEIYRPPIYEIYRQPAYENERYMHFLGQMLYLTRASRQARVHSSYRRQGYSHRR